MRSHSLATWGSAAALALGALTLAPGAAAQAPPRPPPAHAKPGRPPAPAAGSAAPAAKPLGETLTGLAKAEYEAGRLLYGDKDFGNAIVKFELAFDISHDPRLLWNVAVCQKNLRRYARMLATIRRYQQEARDLLTDDERAQSNQIVKTVEAFVSTLKLTASEAGAEVFVDDEKVGTTPLAEGIFVDVGVHKIRVAKPGFKDSVQSQQVGGGGEIALSVQLDKDLHRGRLVVHAGPRDLIALDGKAVGLSHWEGVVSSGGHSLKVTAPGMLAYQSEAVVQDDEVRRIDVTLNPLPRDNTKTVLWIVGGAALAAGAVIGGVFLFKPTEQPGAAGSITPGYIQSGFKPAFGGGKW